jgi:hypothetical protein
MRRAVRLTFVWALVWSGHACSALDTSVGEWLPQDASAGSSASLYIEAESGELSGGFEVKDDSSASAGKYLAPPSGSSSDAMPGPARARYRFRLSEPGTYVIWGRIRGPSVLENRFWFQVDGGAFTKWRISTGDIWYWDDLHDNTQYNMALTFILGAGEHELVLANAVEGVALDRLYLTNHGDTPPGNDTPSRPPHSIEVMGECLLSCGSQRGNACGAAACAGKIRVFAYDCGVCCHVP